MCSYCVACCVCLRHEEEDEKSPSPSDIIYRIDGRDSECQTCDNSFCEYHWKIELANTDDQPYPYQIAKCMDCKFIEQHPEQFLQKIM